MKIKAFLLNKYFKTPVTIDLLIGFALFVLVYRLSIIKIELLGRDSLRAYIVCMIETCVSLSGFILAALTIIITFRANLKSRGLEDQNSALELILSSNSYFQIVSMFKKAILELLIIVIMLYTMWFYSANLKIFFINIFLLCVTLVSVLAIFRSLYILFRLLKGESEVRK